MYMDEGLDTGDILLQTRIPIAPNETGGSLHDRLAEIAPGALREALEQLGRGRAPRIPQDAARATYAPKLVREHGRIDWSEPVALIERKIRAYNPWPGAYTTVRDSSGRDWKLKIFRASLAPRAEGGLSIQEVQLEGRKRMSLQELIRGHPWVAEALRSTISFPTPHPSA